MTDRLIGWKKWRWESQTRWYGAFLHQNLFGEWVITKTWGGKFNNINGTKTETLEGVEVIDSVVLAIKEKREERGYKCLY